MIRFFIGLVVANCWACPCFSQSPIVIDPSERTGATVRYFGWDAKQYGNISNKLKSAQWLYEQSPANILRIPIRPQSSTPDGKAVIYGNAREGKGYGPLIDSIKMAKQVNPEIKLFASTKLLGADTFPDWMDSNQKGKIFRKEVKCPSAIKYASLITDYIEQLAAAEIKVDFIGLNNEVGGALTPEIYFAMAKRIEANLKKSEIPDEFKELQWVGGEEFSVPASVRYARDLKSSRASAKFIDVAGSHFYPNHGSGTIEDWRNLASLGVPTWHTEVHVLRQKPPFENIVALREGLCIVYKTNQQGCEGYIWWGGNANTKVLDNFIRREMIKSMLYGSCVKTSGSYEAKGNAPKLRVSQATRVGDTVWLWYFNPDAPIEQLPVKLTNGQIQSATATCFRGGEEITLQRISELNIKPSGKDELTVQQIPQHSITLVQMQLEDDEELIPLKRWQRLKPKKGSFKASLSQVSKSGFLFKSSTGKSIRVPVKSLDPQHYPEIQDALKAHGIK